MSSYTQYFELNEILLLFIWVNQSFLSALACFVCKLKLMMHLKCCKSGFVKIVEVWG